MNEQEIRIQALESAIKELEELKMGDSCSGCCDVTRDGGIDTAIDTLRALAAAPSPVAQPQQIKPLKRYDFATDDLSRPIAREDENGEFVRHDEAQEQINAAWWDGAASCSASPVAQDEREALEILDNLIASIEKHGNYSKESTLAFLAQLRQCLDAPARAATPAQDKPEYSLLTLLADIRAAAGDPKGKLMQDELVAHIKALAAQDKHTAGKEDQKPYAYEFGKSNGDGTYNVVIERGDLVNVGYSKYEYGPPKNAHKDWPVKPLYERPTPLPAGSRQDAVDADLLDIARTICCVAAHDRDHGRHEYDPSPLSEGSPLLIAAREACLKRGFTADGLAIDAAMQAQGAKE